MRVVIQRTMSASVEVANKTIGSVKKGLLIFVGFEPDDNEEDILWISKKITQLRIFKDADDKMNLSVTDVKAGILVVSQFTLHASTKKGNRPSFIKSATPEKAIPLYQKFIRQLHIDSGIEIQTGEFGANMQVNLLNDGPVTIFMDSKNKD